MSSPSDISEFIALTEEFKVASYINDSLSAPLIPTDKCIETVSNYFFQQQINDTWLKKASENIDQVCDKIATAMQNTCQKHGLTSAQYIALYTLITDPPRGKFHLTNTQKQNVGKSLADGSAIITSEKLTALEKAYDAVSALANDDDFPESIRSNVEKKPPYNLIANNIGTDKSTALVSEIKLRVGVAEAWRAHVQDTKNNFPATFKQEFNDAYQTMAQLYKQHLNIEMEGLQQSRVAGD